MTQCFYKPEWGSRAWRLTCCPPGCELPGPGATPPLPVYSQGLPPRSQNGIMPPLWNYEDYWKEARDLSSLYRQSPGYNFLTLRWYKGAMLSIEASILIFTQASDIQYNTPMMLGSHSQCSQTATWSEGKQAILYGIVLNAFLTKDMFKM